MQSAFHVNKIIVLYVKLCLVWSEFPIIRGSTLRSENLLPLSSPPIKNTWQPMRLIDIHHGKHHHIDRFFVPCVRCVRRRSKRLSRFTDWLIICTALGRAIEPRKRRGWPSPRISWTTAKTRKSPGWPSPTPGRIHLRLHVCKDFRTFIYRDGLKGGLVLLSNIQEGQGKGFSQPRDHFLAHICINLY